MSIACPHCQAGLSPKELKPGRYQPKCLRCLKPFILQVQWVITAPETAPLATPPRPPQKELDAEEQAAALLRGETLGALDIPDELREPGPDTTGDFHEPKSLRTPPKPTSRPTLRPPDRPIPLAGNDPNATGNFNDASSSDDPEKTNLRPALPPMGDDDLEKTSVRPALTPAALSAGPLPSKQPPSSRVKPPPARPADPLKTVTRSPGSPQPAGQGSGTVKTIVRPSVDATGDFSESSSRPQPATGSATEATGDFTEAASHPAQGPARSPEVTAVLTEPPVRPDATSAGAGAADDFSVGPKRSPKVQATSATEAEPESGPPEDDTPFRLGGYEVLKVLGKGGMGAVLLGRQVSLDRNVALKVMHPRIAKNPTFVARFTREAYAAAQLTHHNVIQIYDLGEEAGQHFFSMEFVVGKSLGDIIKTTGKVAPEVAVGYTLQAARGLKYGHNQGMVHRDIKPDNLMLNDQGIVKVADLGLVKLPRKADSGAVVEDLTAITDADPDATNLNELTRAGAVMGTPAYMPPEQGRDSASVDQRADIYSLGCTLYALLTGKPPFEGKTAFEVISKHQTDPLIPPEVVVKRVPKTLSAILLKMMAKKPEDRYSSMDEVIAALEGFLGVDRSGPFTPTEEQADELEKATCQYNVRSKGTRRTMLAVVFGVACVLGVVGAAVAGMAALAGGLLGLMVMAPVAYFVAHGMLTGNVIFTRARAVVFGMRFFDWLVWAGGGALALVTLYLFGLLWAWLGFALVAVGLGFVLWFLTDRPQAKAQEQPLSAARDLFRTMRLKGLDEEAVRQFACKFSGVNWEPFFEGLFGYEAKLAARGYRKGNAGEVSKTAGTWREPVIGWLDLRLEARRAAVERKHLQKVEVKALEAEGVSRSDARSQAKAMASDLVEQAAGAKQARKEGKEVSVTAMVAAARERRRPKPGYTIAGKKHRSLWLKDLLNDWFGRRLRLGLGALVFAAGLMWMSQNDLLSANNNVVKQLVRLDFEAVGQGLDRAAGKPLTVVFLPGELTAPVNSYATPITGFVLILSGLFYFGWRPSLAAIPGAAVGVLGPTLGVPEIGPLGPAMVSLLVGAVVILGVGRFLRQ